MFVHISSLRPGQKQDYKGDMHQDWLKDALTGTGINPKSLNFDMSFEKKGDFVEVDGRITAVLHLECVMCLELFDYPIDNSFRLFFYRDEHHRADTPKEQEINEDDLEFSVLHGDKIELGEILREQLLLALPDYPRCNASCQGINT